MVRNIWDLNYKPSKIKISSLGDLQNPSSTSKKSCPTSVFNQLRIKWWKGKWEGECFCCGRKLDWEHKHAGRIQAGARGGKYTIPNTRLICKTCNGGMGKQNLKVYMRREFPERYEKYFGKDEIKKPVNSNLRKPKKPKSKPQSFNLFGDIKLKTPKINWGL